MYCSNWYEGTSCFDPRFFVDVTDTLEDKIELLKIYESENGRTGGVWEEYVRSIARIMGLKTDVQCAEGFQLIRWRE